MEYRMVQHVRAKSEGVLGITDSGMAVSGGPPPKHGIRALALAARSANADRLRK
jgi:hypothetical protein